MTPRRPAGALALAAVAASCGLAAGSLAQVAAQPGRFPTATQPQTLHVGDQVVVDGVPIGCQVTRIHGSVTLDCRRGGRLTGTYATLLSARKAQVARFTSNHRAKVVFTARHRGAWRRCDRR